MKRVALEAVPGVERDFRSIDAAAPLKLEASRRGVDLWASSAARGSRGDRCIVFAETTTGWVSPDGIMQYGISDSPRGFEIACLRVHDDVEGQTFDVNLDDIARIIGDPNEPGKHRSLIITLLNGEILDRHPYAAKFGTDPFR